MRWTESPQAGILDCLMCVLTDRTGVAVYATRGHKVNV